MIILKVNTNFIEKYDFFVQLHFYYFKTIFLKNNILQHRFQN